MRISAIRLITAASLVMFFGLTMPVLAGPIATPTPATPTVVPTPATPTPATPTPATPTPTPSAPPGSCVEVCQPCHLRPCSEVCTFSGDCHGLSNRCNPIRICREGYKWNQAFCFCQQVGPEVCGSVTCPPGTKCCNAITGACRKHGEGCTAASSSTE